MYRFQKYIDMILGFDNIEYMLIKNTISCAYSEKIKQDIDNIYRMRYNFIHK